MPKVIRPEVLGELISQSARAGLRRAYEQVRVDPDKYLVSARRKYGLAITRWSDLERIDGSVIAPAADDIVASAARNAALEGAGLGWSGLLGTVPDVGILAAITLRMLQRLSLIHGFAYSTEQEVAALWLAAASAAGLDFGREFIEKQAAEKLVPRIIDQIAVKMGAEFAEKWVSRIVPVVSAGVAGILNYYFVRAWGHRARKHFAERRRIGDRLPPTAAPRLLASPSQA